MWPFSLSGFDAVLSIICPTCRLHLSKDPNVQIDEDAVIEFTKELNVDTEKLGTEVQQLQVCATLSLLIVKFFFSFFFISCFVLQ